MAAVSFRAVTNSALHQRAPRGSVETSGGLSDLDNLALMCVHHHSLLPSSEASFIRGDANVELQFVGPSGDVMTTRPSRLWARVSDPNVLAEGRARAKARAEAKARGDAKEAGGGRGTAGGGGKPPQTRVGWTQGARGRGGRVRRETRVSGSR